MLPKTIEMRALRFMEAGKDAIEAVKLAFEEENKMLWIASHGFDPETGAMYKDVQKTIQTELCKRVYNRINSK